MYVVNYLSIISFKFHVSFRHFDRFQFLSQRAVLKKGYLYLKLLLLSLLLLLLLLWLLLWWD